MNKLKLNKLNAERLNQRETDSLKGGECPGGTTDNHYCGCGCCYENSGGSSTYQNGCANWAFCGYSPGCENTFIKPV